MSFDPFMQEIVRDYDHGARPNSTLFNAASAAAIKDIEIKIAAKVSEIDKFEAEAVQLESDVEENILTLTNEKIANTRARIEALRNIEAVRERARLALLEDQLQDAKVAELKARREILSQRVEGRAGQYGARYERMCRMLVNFLEDARDIDKAVEQFNHDITGLKLESLNTIERTARKNGGPSPRPLYFAFEAPGFAGPVPLRVPGTHDLSF